MLEKIKSLDNVTKTFIISAILFILTGSYGLGPKFIEFITVMIFGISATICGCILSLWIFLLLIDKRGP